MIDDGASLIEGPIRRDMVLASEMSSLRRLLEASGLAFRTLSLNLEENAPNQATLLETLGDTDPADVAELLARTGIEEAHARAPGALIIGANQVVSLDGKVLEKPTTFEAARDRLFELCGKTHELHSAVAIAEDGNIAWTHVETAQLTMRAFSPQFVGRYLAAAGSQVFESAGAYQLDGAGLQLFDRIQGDYLTAVGAPIFLLFARLRQIGLMAS
jgi:septum formation protein